MVFQQPLRITLPISPSSTELPEDGLQRSKPPLLFALNYPSPWMCPLIQLHTSSDMLALTHMEHHPPSLLPILLLLLLLLLPPPPPGPSLERHSSCLPCSLVASKVSAS